jgi:DNA polymerase-1
MPQLPGDINMHLVDNIETAWAMKRWLGERREHNVLGLDTETSGLDAWAHDAKLRLIQIGDHKTGWAIPWEGWGGAAIECMNAWEGQWTLHNAAFDAKWLKKHAQWEMPWHRTNDTMIMGQIERPGDRNDLKFLSTQFIDPRADAGQKDLKDAMAKNGWGWGDIPVDLESYWVYSALDPILAAHLYTHFRTDLKFPETYDLEMSVRRICTNMEMDGMRVNIEYSRRKLEELSEYVERSKKWALDTFGFSIGSNVQLADYFANTLNARFDVYTSTNNPSVNKQQLDIFQHSDDPLVKQMADFVLGVRNADKIASSYFKNFVNMHHDGLLHPSIKTMGARTGRMSVTDPALQTIPSKDSLVRSAFLPSNPGESIISCDYSQVELRLMAHFSQDENLINAFIDADRTGEDFFSNLGKQIYNNPDFGKKDPRRKLVKSTMYGLIYGAGVDKMAETAGISSREMGEVVDAVHRTFPGIKNFMVEIENTGNKREKEEGVAYITTGSGRRIPADKGRVYSLLNYTLQGNAAEIMKKAVVRLDAAGFGPYMKMVIHDEVVFSMPDELIEEALPQIQEIMSVTDGSFAVNLLAEPEGPFANWGSKYAQAA